jgi:hypothetical protein
VRDGGPVTFEFPLRWCGPMACGMRRPSVGATRGATEDTTLVADLIVRVETSGASGAAAVSGVVTFAPLAAAPAAVRDGIVTPFVADVESGMQQVHWRLPFQARNGEALVLEATGYFGPGAATVRDWTTAYARIRASAADVRAAGILRVAVRDLVRLFCRLHVSGHSRLGGGRVFLDWLRAGAADPVPVPAALPSAGMR